MAVLNGAVLAALSTGRLTLGLVLSLATYWSGVVGLQLLATAALVVAAGRRRRVSFVGAVDLFFLGHLPWSLLALVCGAVCMVVPDRWLAVTPALALAVPGGLWSLLIGAAFGREILQLRPGEALVAAVAHQTLVWGTTAAALWWASGGWARIPGLAGQ